MKSMTSAEELAEIYEELNFPSANAFHKALKARGIQVRLKDVEEFVRSRSERQIIAPPPKFEGNIVAFGINHRWAADLISFTSRAVKDEQGTFTHLLLVQDIFTRFLWGRPLTAVSHTTQAFEEILKLSEDRMVDANPHPQRCDIDGGPEFANQAFAALMSRYNIRHVIKRPEDRNALATLDRAIGIAKRMIKRRVEAKGGNWLSNYQDVLRAWNNIEQGGIKATPSQVTDNDQFSMMRREAEKLADNTRLLLRRQDNLRKDGAFRKHEPKTTKGLRRRIDDNLWSREIHQVADFTEPGLVRDTQGANTLTKLTLPVPKDSSRLAPTPTQTRDNLEQYAKTLMDKLQKGKTFSQAASIMKAQPGFADALKDARKNFQEIVRTFPQLLRVVQGKILPGNQTTL